MKPAPFQMHFAQSQDEVLKLLDLHGEDARILAGGQTLVPVLAMRVANPKHLIDINQIEEFKRYHVISGALHVGAGVRQSELEDWRDLSAAQPLLKMMFPWIAHTPIRNRGTICGSIAHADPSAELVLALATLDGSVHLASKQRKRTVKANDFFLGALQTDRHSDELITSVQFPIKTDRVGYGFSEFGYRHGDFAVVAVASIKEGSHWTIGFGGIDDTVKVHRFSADSLDDACQAIDQLASTIQVREDPTATSGLRRHLMRTLGRSACQQAVEFRKDKVV
jgi:2-furoyl-CoA dehydrogenase FAD binding subunit